MNKKIILILFFCLNAYEPTAHAIVHLIKPAVSLGVGGATAATTGLAVYGGLKIKAQRENRTLTKREKVAIFATATASGIISLCSTWLGIDIYHNNKRLSATLFRLDLLNPTSFDSLRELEQTKENLKNLDQELKQRWYKKKTARNARQAAADKLKKTETLYQEKINALDQIKKEIDDIPPLEQKKSQIIITIKFSQEIIDRLANLLPTNDNAPHIQEIKEKIAEKQKEIEKAKEQWKKQQQPLNDAIKQFDAAKVADILDKKEAESMLQDEDFNRCIEELKNGGPGKDSALEILHKMVPNELLSYAAEQQDEKLMRLFLDKGLDPNKPSKKGWLPLHMAVSQSNTALTKLLLEKKADVNLHLGDSQHLNTTDTKHNKEYNYSRYSPLDVACAVDTDNHKIIKLLLEAGASLDEKDLRLHKSFHETIAGLLNGSIYFTQRDEFPHYEAEIINAYNARIERDRIEAERKRKEEEERKKKELEEEEKRKQEEAASSPQNSIGNHP